MSNYFWSNWTQQKPKRKKFKGLHKRGRDSRYKKVTGWSWNTFKLFDPGHLHTFIADTSRKTYITDIHSGQYNYTVKYTKLTTNASIRESLREFNK